MRARHPPTLATLAATVLLGACAGWREPAELLGPLRKETVWAVSDAAELLRFNAGQPQRPLRRGGWSTAVPPCASWGPWVWRWR